MLCPSQVDPSVTVNVAHPTTCAKYMSCVHTHPMEMYCPGGLEWNDHDSLCDYPDRSGCVRNVPEEVARLNGSALAAASVCLPQETSGCPLNSSPGEVALRKHRNCRMYYSCSLGKESPMYCPKGLYWNAGSCRCDYESDVECGEDGERPVEEEAVDDVPEEVQEQAEEQQEEEPQQEEEQPDQEEPTQEHETYEFPEDFEQPSILLAEPQVEYEPSPRLRFRRDAGDTTESSNSAGSTGAESSGSTTVAGNSGSSDSPGSSGGSGGSGNSGGSGGSGGNKPIEGGNGDGIVAAGAGIREVSAFAVMLATLVLNAM
uniref:Peritrophin-1 n=2 Tax=Culex pipiens TaxID=7175 RepID=A0A8D8AXJ3_CULPI